MSPDVETIMSLSAQQIDATSSFTPGISFFHSHIVITAIKVNENTIYTLFLQGIFDCNHETQRHFDWRKLEKISQKKTLKEVNVE